MMAEATEAIGMTFRDGATPKFTNCMFEVHAGNKVEESGAKPKQQRPMNCQTMLSSDFNEMAKVSEEKRECSLFNGVWMNVENAKILSVFCNEEAALMEKGAYLGDEYKRILPLPEELLAPTSCTLEAGFDCIEPRDLKIDGSPTNKLKVDSPPLRKKSHQLLYFKPIPHPDKLEHIERYEVSYYAKLYDSKCQLIGEGIDAPLDFSWPLHLQHKLPTGEREQEASTSDTQNINIDKVYASGNAYIGGQGQYINHRQEGREDTPVAGTAFANQMEYLEHVKGTMEQFCRRSNSLMQEFSLKGGSIELDGCGVHPPPGAIKKNLEIEVSVGVNPCPSPSSGTQISRMLKRKPSNMDSPIPVKLTSWLTPKPRKKLPVMILSKIGDTDWKVIHKRTLNAGNIIEYNASRFCWHVAVVSEEDEKNGEYHLFNDMWMHVRTGRILSVFWKDEIALQNASKALESDHKRILPIPGEIIVSVGDTLIVDIQCNSPPGVRMTNVEGSDARVEITHERMKKNFFTLLFWPNPHPEKIQSAEPYDVVYSANTLDAEGQPADGGFSAPLDYEWPPKPIEGKDGKGQVHRLWNRAWVNKYGAIALQFCENKETRKLKTKMSSQHFGKIILYTPQPVVFCEGDIVTVKLYHGKSMEARRLEHMEVMKEKPLFWKPLFLEFHMRRSNALNLCYAVEILRSNTGLAEEVFSVSFCWEPSSEPSSEDEEDTEDPSHDAIFSYQPTDKDLKAILRYLSKSQQNKDALCDALKACGSNLIDLSSEEIEAELPKMRSKGENPPQQRCKDCIDSFMACYSSWNEKLDNCSSTDVTHIISVLAKYISKCFGTWYTGTKTILVIGPKAVVAEVKASVEDHIANTDEKVSTALAHSFEYDETQPPIVRFVSRQRQLKAELSTRMDRIAIVEIKEEKPKVFVCVSPSKHTRSWLHHAFEGSCKERLKAFFQLFDSWRGKYNPAAVKAKQRQAPEFFKTSSYPDHFVQWYPDTGTVNVTGSQAQVLRCRLIIEQMLGVSSNAPHKQNYSASPGFPSRPAVPLFPPIAPPPNFLGQPIYPLSSIRSPIHQLNPAASSSPPQDSQPQRTRRSSSADYSDNPTSPRSEMILFNTEEIPPAVLKFVLNDLALKKELEKCCKTVAKVIIKSDHGHLKVHIIFKQKKYSEKDKTKVFSAVRTYFGKFASQTKKYDPKKLKELVEKYPTLFMPTAGVYITHFPGTVKITGLTQIVLEKEAEIDYEIHAETEEELITSADVFIAQRECEVWKKVQEECGSGDSKISITSTGPGKIQYRGTRSAITHAKQVLGKISEELIQKPITGLSPDQIAYLRKCRKSQKEYLKTGENMLDSLYQEFKGKSIHGSLAFQDLSTDLVCTDNIQWQRADNLLAQIIIDFEVDLSGDKPDVSFTKLCKIIKAQTNDEPAYVKEQANSKKILVFCLQRHKAEIERKITEIVNKSCNVEEVEKFYPMTEERARHIQNPHSQCKIYKAKTIKFGKQKGKCGLLVTCENEDIDAVDMSFEDLELEIEPTDEKMTGYSLYEYLMKDEKHFRIERETNCSIFLKKNQKKPVRRAARVCVKVGDILNEKCDAIVNSTGKSVSFAGQVSQALARKYGKNALEATMRHAKWIIKDQVILCPSSGLLPWNYILNVATPKGNQLKKFFLDLLTAADKVGIRSIALPTIGTGNMGLDPISVAISMKDAFREFCCGKAVTLKDIRLVVYEPSMFPAFKDIAPKDDTEEKSTELVATIYGNNQSSLQKTVEKLKEIRDDIIKSVFIEDASLTSFPEYVKSLAREICRKNEVYLEWKTNGIQEQCHLEGVADNVKRAEDEINKLLGADFPPNWSPMLADQLFVKEKLDKTSEEYQKVRAKFKESSPSYTKISKIERIQNPFLYKQFKTRKDIKQTENGTRSVTKQLFHGTAIDKVDKICASGFDRNYAGENGTAFGRGVYFHVNSRYSASYAGHGPVRCVFLADVITGDYTQGRAEYKSPPEKPDSKMLYDSVVDNIVNPNIYVVFRDASVYPSYLITFQ